MRNSSLAVKSELASSTPDIKAHSGVVFLIEPAPVPAACHMQQQSDYYPMAGEQLRPYIRDEDSEDTYRPRTQWVSAYDI